MAVNKVVYGKETLIDLTGDSVTAEKLLEGETAHNAAGERIVGTATQGGGSLVVTDDNEGNITIQNAHVTYESEVLTVTLAINSSEENGNVTVGG